MTLRTALSIICAMIASRLTAQSFQQPKEWEFNVEAGLDFKPRYAELATDAGRYVIARNARQRSPSPFVALSATRRIPGLRAFYGVRADANYSQLTLDNSDYEGENSTATLMATYRAFGFDMQGDCDCPTWGDDSWLKKAFFFELGLGGGYQQLRSNQASIPDDSKFGGAYLLRLGVSHRLNKQVDVYLAAGAQGVITSRSAFRTFDVGARPALGLTYRPRP